MENMKKKVLLGATEEELIFGEFELSRPRFWSKEKGHYQEKWLQFSASFNTELPFCGNTFDYERYYEDWQEGLDKSYLYDLCKQYDCSPRRLASNLAEECCDPRDCVDCSTYPEEIEVDGALWYFESSSGGQHDTRNEIVYYVNKELYDLLHELWDNFHLRKADADAQEKFMRLMKACKKMDEYAIETDWISAFIAHDEEGMKEISELVEPTVHAILNGEELGS